MNEIARKLILDQSSLMFLVSGILNIIVFAFLVLNKNFNKDKSRQYLAISIISVAIWMFSSWFNHFV